MMINNKQNSIINNGSAAALLIAISVLILSAAMQAQSPTPSASPSPLPDVKLGDYKVTAAMEFGWRWRSVDGNFNKYRSDLNYARGFRSFDSNILLEGDEGKGKYFDSLLISNSGWGSDPTGFTRVNMDKAGSYKANLNLRRVRYFNNLVNHALNEHNADTAHSFGDFDITLFPQNEKFRVLAGVSTSRNQGTGSFTTRAYSDEFAIKSFIKARTQDYRFGVEGKAMGFNYGLSQGFRMFNDRSIYTLLAPSPGNNPTNTAALATFERQFPTLGKVSFTQGFLHRTFEKKLDFTARLIYSSTETHMEMTEQITGRDNSNNVVILDTFNINSVAKRPQMRGDLGLTYMVTDKFRLSNTFTFDRFSVNGGENYDEALYRRTNAGGALATTFTRSVGYRVDNYRRFVNFVEGDYQFNSRAGFHIGYRFTQRMAEIVGFDRTFTSPTSGTNPLLIAEEETNHTNTLVAGMKIKPLKNWVIFSDVEHGSADNVFTRVENYHFTNFRARSRVTIKNFTLNLSGITKDNNNPSNTAAMPTAFDYTTTVKHRNFSGSIDWTPIPELSFSTGYTYRRLTSYTPIILPVGGVSTTGFSQFFSREHYGFFDVSAQPFRRLSIYASYRIDRDRGQGGLFSTVTQNIITSYPMRFATPEVRAAIRLTSNIDWNIGYQNYSYRDSQTPQQNYRAHLPYTSLRIYWGRDAANRR